MRWMQHVLVVTSLAVSGCGDSEGNGGEGSGSGSSADGGETDDGAGTDSGGATGDGGDSSGSGTTGGGDGTTGGSGDSGTTEPPDVDCPAMPLEPGLHPLTITHDGLERVYDLYIPASHDGTEAAPLVFNLHPLTLGAALHPIWTTESGMNDKSEEGGFIVVQPDGTGSPASWNAGAECCAPANADGVDDVGFIMALADEVATMACIDPARIYSMGMSNGAYLSHRIACEQSSFVAAIGPVVGSLSAELECELDRAVPVIQISGSEDMFASREASFERWRDLNGCTDTAEETYSMGSATCVTHDECDDGVEVTHCVVWDGGHCFFSDISPQLTPGCSAMTDLISPDVLWDFLQRWRLP